LGSRGDTGAADTEFVASANIAAASAIVVVLLEIETRAIAAVLMLEAARRVGIWMCGVGVDDAKLLTDAAAA
jgi:hypothetical protein